MTSIGFLRWAYVLAYGAVVAVRLGKVNVLARSWLCRKNIVMYCNQHGHLRAVVGLANMISRRRNVLLLISFDPGLVDGLDEKVKIEGNFKQECILLVGAKIFVTPVVGFPSGNRPWLSKTIHLMISLGSVSGLYRQDHFDGYDYIFCAGPRQIEELSTLFRKRNLKNKSLIRGGYPKLDLQIQSSHCHRERDSNCPTILYAPTHRVGGVNDDSVSLARFAKLIISTLLDAGFKVVFRPHPVSFNDSDQVTIEEIDGEFSRNKNYSLDSTSNYMKSYSSSDILLTDLSGTAFTYAFSFLRPVIFFLPENKICGQRSQFHSDCSEIGAFVHEASDLPSTCLNLIEDKGGAKKISNFRSKFIYNLGRSNEYLSSCIELLLTNKRDPEWVSFD